METTLYSPDKAPRIAGPKPGPRAGIPGNPSQTRILGPPPLPRQSRWLACDLMAAEACVVPQWWLLSFWFQVFDTGLYLITDRWAWDFFFWFLT